MKENVIALLEEHPGEPPSPVSTKGRDGGSLRRPKSQSISFFVVVALDILIIGFLVAVVFTSIKLTSIGPLSGDHRTLYVTSVTVLATICTTFFIHVVRELWLQKIDTHLQSGTAIAVLDPTWRNVIGLSSFTERLKQWEMTVILAVSGLVTATIVGATVPTSMTHTERYRYHLVDDHSDICAGINPSLPSQWAWDLPNGSVYNVWPEMQFCPTAEAITHLGTINMLNPDAFGYADEGTAVRRSALGAAASIYVPQTPFDWGTNMVDESLAQTLQHFGPSLLSTTQCTPVMTTNPIQCETVTAVDDQVSLTIHGPSNCSLITSYQNSYAATLCTHDSLGQATIVLGAVYPSSFFLTEAMADLDYLSYLESASSANASALQGTAYGVACTVDTRQVFEYREVTFNLQADADDIGTYSRDVEAVISDSCDGQVFAGDHDPLQHKIPAVAAVAAVSILDNLLAATRQLIVQPMSPIYTDHSKYVRQAPFAFENSRNGLEDVLGLNAALVVSRLPMTGGSGTSSAEGIAIVQNTRVGTGRKWALVYILPLVLVLVTLIWLRYTVAGAPRMEISNSLRALEMHFREEMGHG
ncbi:hypothetical protein LTR84_001748 [Exophiala bonariae]|uniref:Carboxylic ester hydrolase n=1 Tax=Exophiala bonariae TaxID=1690606 RepID=A0AAV9NF01_9EURO|nr:hypothetical protein LTR84_001748 [Exophiala bonariae]